MNRTTFSESSNEYVLHPHKTFYWLWADPAIVRSKRKVFATFLCLRPFVCAFSAYALWPYPYAKTIKFKLNACPCEESCSAAAIMSLFHAKWPCTCYDEVQCVQFAYMKSKWNEFVELGVSSTMIRFYFKQNVVASVEEICILRTNDEQCLHCGRRLEHSVWSVCE